MKVLLINPPSNQFLGAHQEMNPPLGLAYIAAVLEERGMGVEILDMVAENYGHDELRKKILESIPEVIGVTLTTETRFNGFEVIRLAKETLPNAITIAGGPHITFTAYDSLSNIPELDIAVIGEGEYTILDLIDTLEQKDDLKSVKGIVFRKGRRMVQTTPRSFIDNLDDLTFPARHLLPMEKYNTSLKVPEEGKLEATNILTSRGCPYNCIFCSSSKFWGRKCRLRSPLKVIDEIEHIMERYGVKAIIFDDDTFTINKKRVEKICDRIIERNLDISWKCAVRVNSVNPFLLKKMNDAGCFSIEYGVESGSQKILDNINKGITLNQARNVKRWSKKLGILSRAFFIISFPNETTEDSKKTVKIMRELKEENCNLGINILKIYPGIGIEEIAKQKGVLPREFSWSKRRGLKNTAFPTIFGGDAPLFIDKLTWDQISDILFEFRDIQGYPILERLPSVIKNIRSFDDMKRLLEMFNNYFKRKVNIF